MTNTSDKEYMQSNLDKLHITPMGDARIKLNTKSNKDIVTWVKQIINNEKSRVTKRGKNFYVQMDNLIFTVTASSMTIITGHYLK